jgi:hypothetical protein
MADFVRDTTVGYVNKDFDSLKRDLIAYAQAHFSGSFQDFNETSPGMAILELQAYIGDVLSFYIDQNFLEMKQETARQLKNVEAFAKQLGYRPKGKRTARVPLKVIVELPATTDSTGNRVPDYTYAPVIKAGSQFIGPNSTIFESLEDLDFSLTPANVVVASRDNAGVIAYFAIRREVQCVAGTTVKDTINVTSYTPYLRVNLSNKGVQEVLSVTDSNGYTWYEVDFLSQNMVFDQVSNTNNDSTIVPYIMKLRSAPRRFTVDYSPSKDATTLQFGPGQGLKNDDELIPSIANISLPIAGRQTVSNFSLDPQNFLKTRSLGLSPYNTTLYVRYRIGGGEETNVPKGTINKPGSLNIQFKSNSLVQTKMDAVTNSVECINIIASEGGGAAETMDEIKTNAGSYFASQRRCVTREDYLTHVFSMPEKFGRPEKAFIKQNEFDPFAVDIHVLSLDANANLIHPSVILKQNIQTWLSKLRMMTEGVNILNGSIINIGVNFGVVISPRKNRSEVMTNCFTALKNYFDISKMQIGQPIVISDIEATLQSLDGVVSVYKLNLTSFYGISGGYTYPTDISSFDVSAATKHGILYCPDGCIFEVRHPENDIVGESK